jgi:hypothetical protein
MAEASSRFARLMNEEENMPIETVARYSRQMLRDRPEALFVFGDNVSLLGRGGQARECRGEPNAVGIPTKWHPTMDEDAFLRDDQFERIKPGIDAAFMHLVDHLRSGGTVVWPADGVGTGLAQLPQRAPRIHAYIQRAKARMDEIAAGSSPD